jgi:N-acetyl-alpha-D-glucosaminyl L-malate synthase BshA
VRIAVELADGLAQRGHQVYLFARTQPMGIDSFGPGVRFVGLNGHRPALAADRLDAEWSSGDLRALVRRILSVADAAPLDVLHFHYAVPFARVTDEVGRRLGARRPRLVGTLHGTDVTVYASHRRTRAGLVRRLASLDAVTTVSRAYQALSANVLRLPDPPVVIPNFVDLGRFRPQQRVAPRRPRLVHVSNFRRVKEPEMVARVFARVRRQIDAELWLVGDGETMRSVRRVLRSAGLHEDVCEFGLRRDVETIVREADVLLVTSRSESFCLAALEAAACGVPAVAGRVGGLPEVVANGQTGLLYDPGDEGAAAEAVLRLLADPAHRAALGRAARAWAARFSAETIVPRYEELYEQVASGRAVEPVVEAVG